MSYHYKPVVLTILDGFGIAPDSDGNAVARANMINYKKYLRQYPAMTLSASGSEVGLLFGQMGNSEVGHLNIGAGRIYYQSCPRLNQAISDGTFFTNKAFLEAINRVKKNKSRLHLVGMVGVGRVHSSDDHLYALLELCKKEKLKSDQVFVHAVLDGRDCIYNSGLDFIKNLQDKMKELGIGQIASLSGRFYAMDRDNRWDRIEAAYRAMAEGKSDHVAVDPIQAITDAYAQKNYDEEFVPTVIMDKKRNPLTTIRSGDAAIFFNFRPDRARELTKAFVLPGFEKFERNYIKDLYFVTMMEYEKDLPVLVAYNPLVVRNSLAETVSKAGAKQFHIAETQKYAHITFFLNGTIESPFENEDRAIIPSAKVTNFADKPEMSAYEITKEATKAIDSGKYDLIAVNIANPDMVGHTGDFEATKKACEVTDECAGKIVDHTLAQGGVVIITADHGNAEEVLNLQTGAMDKEHSTNPVPFLIIGKDFVGQAGPSGDPPEGDLSLMQPVGMLSDIAPTILKLMGIEQPADMTGKALI
ncbi:MAG: 2,3-bisphosphoglycerate-independent phosphoglycerate mutase [Candidatus Magasanikbacteria bacterium]